MYVRSSLRELLTVLTHLHEQYGPPSGGGYRGPGGFTPHHQGAPPGADPQYVERTTYSRCELVADKLLE